MKTIWIVPATFFLCLNIIIATASENTENKQFSSYLPTTDSRYKYIRKINSARLCEDGTLLITTIEESDVSTPGSPRINRAISCDLTGKILGVYNFPFHGRQYWPDTNAALIGDNCKLPPLWMWIHHAPPISYSKPVEDDRIYIGGPSEEKEALIVPGGQSIWRWWLLRQGQLRKLIVLKSGSAHRDNDPNADTYQAHKLVCYLFDDKGCTLQNEFVIEDEHFQSREIECAIDGNDIVIWQIIAKRPPKPWGHPTGHILRVAKWTKETNLSWTKCYSGGDLIHNLAVDPAHGSVATIGKRHTLWLAADDTIIVLRDSKILHTTLVSSYANRSRPLYLGEGICTWAAVSWNSSNMFVSFLDDKLKVIDRAQIPPKLHHIYESDVFLVLKGDELYLVMLDEKGGVVVKDIPCPRTQDKED